MKNFLLLLLCCLMLCCQRHPQRTPEPELVSLPVELWRLPIGASSIFPDGYWYTRLNDSAALKTNGVIAWSGGKIKIKNSFNTNVDNSSTVDNSQKKSNNTEAKQKDVGNTDVGKKGAVLTGEGNVLDESVTKDKTKVKPDGPLVNGNDNTVTTPLIKARIPGWVWVPIYAVIVAIIGVVWWYRKFG